MMFVPTILYIYHSAGKQLNQDLLELLIDLIARLQRSFRLLKLSKCKEEFVAMLQAMA